MVQSLTQSVTFEEFVDWYPTDSEVRYELRRGVIVEMPQPRGKHSRVAGDLAFELGVAMRDADAPYFIPRECIVRGLDESGYEPDVIVLDERALVDEPSWESGSSITLGRSVRLIVEVVSTNWRDDYHLKFADYEALGIKEYWIVDYLGLGGRRYIGSPKQPTLTVCNLVDGEYEMRLFRGDDVVVLQVLPGLVLTAQQVLQLEQ